MHAQIRKYKHSLIISGTAIILFSIWTIAKSVISMILQQLAGPDFAISSSVSSDKEAQLEILLSSDESSETTFFILLFVLLILFAFLLINILLRIYIGRTAIMIGRGKKKDKKAYFIIAIILFIYEAITDIWFIRTTFFESGITAIIIEFTYLYAYFEVIYSSIKVRRLSKLIEASDPETDFILSDPT